MKLANCFRLAFYALVLSCPALNQADEPRNVVPFPGTTEIQTLPQNWDDEAEWFYNAAQGSLLLPYKWFLHLEQPDSETRLRETANIQRLGYLARAADSENPDGLPIGFVKDERVLASGLTESFLGLTCAACHTGHVTYQGTMYLVDGAPTHGDFEELMRQLEQSLAATVKDKEKLRRFSDRVLGEAATDAARTSLTAQLNDSLTARRAYNERNLPAAGAVHFGPGRVDAFGAIMNEVAVRCAGVPDNAAPANAPVSYPVLWDAPQHDFVQWNGAAENKRSRLTRPIVGTDHIGALGRNTGEVLGVFGEIDATEEPPITQLRHYPNSANRENLIAIEDSLRNLW